MDYSEMARVILRSHYKVTRGLLAMDLAISNHGQVTRTAPDLTHPLPITTSHQREDIEIRQISRESTPLHGGYQAPGLEPVTFRL
ncbi:hypothetical protein TNCV_3867951 [Trichonephila clavipes]|nr:hypothetical protein TNCV_3867951 [Trichonephila clavipes]